MDTKAYTEEMVEKAALALYNMWRVQSGFGETGNWGAMSHESWKDSACTVLDAVADDLRAEGAREALMALASQEWDRMLGEGLSSTKRYFHSCIGEAALEYRDEHYPEKTN